MEGTKDQPVSSTYKLPCFHLTHERIFYKVLKDSQRYYNIWHMSEGQRSYATSPPQHVVDDMITGPTKFLRFKEIALRLDTHRHRGCQYCAHRNDGTQNDDASHMEDLLPPHPSTNTAGTHHRSGHSSTNANLLTNHNTDPIVEAIPLHSVDSNAQQISPHNSNHNFDDYDSAPVLQAQHNTSDKTWSFDGYGNFMLETCWGTWIDCGYRLVPGFFSMFPHSLPAQHLEHLLPTLESQTQELSDTGSSEPLSSSWATNSVASPFSDDPIIHAVKPLRPDLPELTLGLRGMLDEAGPLENTMDSQNIFVCGKGRTGELFCVDPTVDETKIVTKDISTSYDLDSLIYVTHWLKFLAAMHLHLSPLVGSWAPFWKTNQVHIKILCPPTEVGSCSTTTKTFTLNQIPHTHFGQLGTGSVTFNIYIFFPRMIHKHATRKFMFNMIPLPVQELWFSNAIIPAVREVFYRCFSWDNRIYPRKFGRAAAEEGFQLWAKNNCHISTVPR